MIRHIGLITTTIAAITFGDPQHANGESEGNSMLNYPRRVAIPNDVPSTKYLVYRRKDGVTVGRTFLPSILYLRGHFDGWNNCIGRVIARRDFQNIGEPGAVSSPEPYTNRGIRDGFALCKQQIMSMLSCKTSDEVVELCRSARMSFEEIRIAEQARTNNETSFEDPFDVDHDPFEPEPKDPPQ